MYARLNKEPQPDRKKPFFTIKTDDISWLEAKVNGKNVKSIGMVEKNHRKR